MVRNRVLRACIQDSEAFPQGLSTKTHGIYLKSQPDLRFLIEIPWILQIRVLWTLVDRATWSLWKISEENIAVPNLTTLYSPYIALRYPLHT